ncbi:MAG TPA: peptide-N-glycosidase F-related protein [Bacteroidales bacterium]|nr:peptide-N-glycosidase F-related protein [Bacteroidales bacterium]
MKKIRVLFALLLVTTMMMQPLLLRSQSNQYLHFDMVDDFCQLVNASQYVSGTTQLSITGWFYCDALAYGQGYMGFRAGSGTAEFYLIQLNNGVMECRLVTTAGFFEYVAPANTVIPQVWQHIAWIYDGSSIKLYVNGALKGSKTASGTFLGPAVNFGIGKSLLGGYNFVYGGRIDEVSVWNKALTQTEIQDMMANELTGTEANLQLYYKFNQGVPGGNNTSITKLECEIGNGERDADLLNFALTGQTSNFNGTLDPGYQAISFPQIPDHLTTDPPFTIEATATSGLPVQFEVLSGPATIVGNTVTLTGAMGEVTVKATQPGNGTFNPAEPVINKFMALDPMTYVPDIDPRHPLAGDVYVPTLSKILLSVYSTIGHPALFSVPAAQFEINGEIIPAQTYHNGHFIGWWTPPNWGTYTVKVVSYNNYGAFNDTTYTINVVQQATSQEVTAAQNVWLNPNNVSQVVAANLPSYLGAFNKIDATLSVSCPPGGCGEWDRVASVDVKGHDGKWYEIIRYITPYGKACTHHIDLTDYMSLLLGKTEFRFNCSTLDNGYYYALTLNYTQGTPPFLYSTVHEVWNNIYNFGDYANLQPVPEHDYTFPADAASAKLKLVSTGHGWGDLNTGNAAEFYEATHHIWVNGVQTFDQHNWWDCNPNPDGCQPQNGTWYYDRAGWCPGTIAQFYDYDMTPFLSGSNVALKYVFYENYIDLCHPNNPNCVTGVTCSNCADGFNPTLDVACNLVTYATNPLMTGADDRQAASRVNVHPNPTTGGVEVYAFGSPAGSSAPLELLTISGTIVGHYDWNGKSAHLDLSPLPKGVYLLKVRTAERTEMKKIILQ